MGLDLFPSFLQQNYEMHEWRHASSILAHDFPSEFSDICTVLTEFRVKHSHIATGGGNKSPVAGLLDGGFTRKKWKERKFDTSFKVDEVTIESPTHKVDCFKNRIALEIEWNNKDPFFDRDLNNFRLLFDLQVVSVGVIVTRCDDLQDVFDAIDRGSSYGNSTTHMSKLLPRIKGGGGGGCPILVFGISKTLYAPDL